jgi:adenine-specific DNA methylase
VARTVPDDLASAASGVASDLQALYATAFPATRRGPLYNAFSYPTKISPEAIALFIATHTRPGETVLDAFAGSGTTGIAAKLCDRPTPAMLALADTLKLTPSWGPRTAVLYEVGVLGSFVARVMSSPPDPERFSEAAGRLIDSAESTHGWLYETRDASGEPATIRYTIWSDLLACPHCGAEISYWDAAVRESPLELAKRYCCPGCDSTTDIAACRRVTERAPDPLLGRASERRRRVPVRVYGRTGRTNWKRPVDKSDGEVAARAAGAAVPASAPNAEIVWGDLHRSGYHTGISHLHHFYTPRNFLAIAVLWDLIEQFDEDLQDALRLLVLSFNATHSTLMTRVVVKQNQKDFALTGAQSGVLYISGLPVEKNVFEGVRRKLRTFSSAFALVQESTSTVKVVNASSTALDLADGSVAYVFTDPPFGDYIPYAELNQLNELWLGNTTDRAEEIVMSAAGGKDAQAYGDLMADVFQEIARVLTPDGLATIVFHSAKASVWQALTSAYAAAGLGVRTTSVLDKTQASFKQVVSAISVKGDPLIVLDKQSRDRHPYSVNEVIAAVLAEADDHVAADERTRERLFSRFITRCLLEDIAVTIGASEFYARIALSGSSA